MLHIGFQAFPFQTFPAVQQHLAVLAARLWPAARFCWPMEPDREPRFANGEAVMELLAGPGTGKGATICMSRTIRRFRAFARFRQCDAFWDGRIVGKKEIRRFTA